MTSSLLLALGIISSSFFGSVHCVGMCGPIASLMASRKTLWSYHFGRLSFYIFLGTIAGWGGQFFLKNSFATFRTVSIIFFSLLLLYLGLEKFFPQLTLSMNPLSQLLHRTYGKVQRLFNFKNTNSGYIAGLLTGLLPCGWLYTYVLAAAATQSPWAGALTMALFWLGGLPALSALSLILKKGLEVSSSRQQKITGAILIAASLYSLISFTLSH